MNATVSSSLGRLPFFLYGAASYGLFLCTFVYSIGFVGNLVVPKSVDTGAAGPAGVAILVNLLLLTVFALQHSIMARPGFKERWTKFVPEPIERSTYVLATCIVFGLLFWQWRPLPQVVWHVGLPAVRSILYGLFAFGWVLVLYSTFCIDHFHLFGLRQVVLHLRGKPYIDPGLATPLPYRLVRNPLMLGFIIAFWSAPVMTQGRLLFCIVTTAYILVAIQLEERDLLRALGEQYRRYRERTPMLLPIPRRHAPGSHAVESEDRSASRA